MIPINIQNKEVVIKCEGAGLVDIDQLIIIQGELKELTQENYIKISKSIMKKGFIAPFFIWKDNGLLKILDGTQRKLVLTDMRKDGWKIPPLPAAFIYADNLTDAKEKLLDITSAFGQITPEGLYQFGTGIDMKSLVDNIKLPDFNMGMFKIGFLDFEQPVIDLPEKEKKKKAEKPIVCPHCGEAFDLDDE